MNWEALSALGELVADIKEIRTYTGEFVQAIEASQATGNIRDSFKGKATR